MNLEERVANLERVAAQRGAQFEALQTLVIACVATISDRPIFVRALQLADNDVTANRLNQLGISEDFISMYRDHLRALTPLPLRDQLP